MFSASSGSDMEVMSDATVMAPAAGRQRGHGSVARATRQKSTEQATRGRRTGSSLGRKAAANSAAAKRLVSKKAAAQAKARGGKRSKRSSCSMTQAADGEESFDEEQDALRMKKELRRLRNRESAAASRRRKANRLVELEGQVAALAAQNQALTAQLHKLTAFNSDLQGRLSAMMDAAVAVPEQGDDDQDAQDDASSSSSVGSDDVGPAAGDAVDALGPVGAAIVADNDAPSLVDLAMLDAISAEAPAPAPGGMGLDALMCCDDTTLNTWLKCN